MDVVQLWARVSVLGPHDTLAGFVLSGVGQPDLGAVDEIARLELWARRRGGRVVVRDLCPGLRALLELSGLRVEVEG